MSRQKKLLTFLVLTSSGFSLPSHAQEVSSNTENILPLTNVVAEKHESNIGVSLIDKEKIKSISNTNGHITGVLSSNPSVAFDNSRGNSNSPGLITPDNISINGAKFYQNQFLLDGSSINSGISGGVGNISSNHENADFDISQGLAVDASMLCSITVRDSGVSAAYGRFTGGVVEAEVCAPERRFGGGFSLEHTKSKWLEKKSRDNAASTSPEAHNDFHKWTYRGNFESKISESLGFIGNFSRKTTVVPLSAYAGGNYRGFNDNLSKNYEQKIDNFYLKSFFGGSGVRGNFFVTEMPSSEFGFKENTKNSGYEGASGGSLYGVGLDVDVGYGVLKQKISYKKVQSSRLSDMDEYRTWQYSDDKNWGTVSKNRQGVWKGSSNEGGSGDIEQKQNVYNYKASFESEPINALNGSHAIEVGLEAEKDNFHYSRSRDFYAYTTATVGGLSPFTNSCMTVNGLDSTHCSLGPTWENGQGQYLNRRDKYRKGSVEHNADYYSVFIQNSSIYNSFVYRYGVRVEKFSDSDDVNYSPRINFDYLTGRENLSVINFGYNRYYGQNLKAYTIAYKRSLLKMGTEQRKKIHLV